MAKAKKQIWISFNGDDLLESFARLADVAPTEMVVLSEETDWGLIGGDLRYAMDLVESEIANPISEDHEELVEA
jgi:hypothetical protein